jgi:hypothetical protein
MMTARAACPVANAMVQISAVIAPNLQTLVFVMRATPSRTVKNTPSRMPRVDDHQLSLVALCGMELMAVNALTSIPRKTCASRG